MKIKVCGLREPDNLAAICGLEVDYLGLVFHPASPRFAGQPSLAGWLTANEELLRGVELVGVFVNAELDYIINTVHDYRLDWVQLHGTESPDYCRELRMLWSVSSLSNTRICKAFSITEDFDFAQTKAYAATCPLFIFDHGKGGTGHKWDWAALERYRGDTPFLLSGGIGPGDAPRVLRLDHPQLAGVDVNSRFEAKPGIKDVERLRPFVKAVRPHAAGA